MTGIAALADYGRAARPASETADSAVASNRARAISAVVSGGGVSGGITGAMGGGGGRAIAMDASRSAGIGGMQRLQLAMYQQAPHATITSAPGIVREAIGARTRRPRRSAT